MQNFDGHNENDDCNSSSSENMFEGVRTKGIINSEEDNQGSMYRMSGDMIVDKIYNKYTENQYGAAGNNDTEKIYAYTGNGYKYSQNSENYFEQQPEYKETKIKHKKEKRISAGKIKQDKIKSTDKKKTGFMKKAVAIVTSAAVFGAAAGGVFIALANDTIDELRNAKNYTSEPATTEGGYTYTGTLPTTSLSSDDGSSMNYDVSDVVEASMPSVVAITITAMVEYYQGFGTSQYEAEGSGSGIIIGSNDTELLVATNNHVIEGATSVTVTFVDEEAYEATVKAADDDSDLAIVSIPISEISDSTLSQIKVASLNTNGDSKVGEQVVAIGNALGYGQSVTTGIISALNRYNDTNDTPLIQTDAAINPGNSGGALLNMDGEVIGINSSKYSATDVEGVGYAISVSEVQTILDELINEEPREEVAESDIGYLGIVGSDINESYAEAYGIPMGAYINDVAEDSAADKSGIEKYSIITEFDGEGVDSMTELSELMDHYKAGETVDIVVAVLEDGEYVEHTLTVTLQKRPSNIEF